MLTVSVFRTPYVNFGNHGNLTTKVTCNLFTICVCSRVVSKQMQFLIICIMRHSDSMKKNDDEDDHDYAAAAAADDDYEEEEDEVFYR